MFVIAAICIQSSQPSSNTIQTSQAFTVLLPRSFIFKFIFLPTAMSIASKRFPSMELFPIRFRHGRVVRGSTFERQVNQDSHCRTENPRLIHVGQSDDGSTRIDLLEFAGHIPEQLNFTLKRFAERRGACRTRCQVAAISRFNIAIKEQSHQILEDNCLLMEYFNIFDQIFFFGCLKGLVNVEFKLEMTNRDDFGICAHQHHDLASRQTIPDNFAASISIRNLSRDPNYSPQRTRLEKYLGTLLHEMLHAYLGIYMCDCCPRCHQLSDRIMGTSGHGPTWHEAAFALEQATHPLIGRKLELGRRNGMISEYGPDYRNNIKVPEGMVAALEL